MIEKTDVIIMIDTETTNDIDCPIVYDVGYQVFTLNEGVLCERSFVNADVFLDKDLMASAFFLDKVPNYWDEIKAGKRVLKKWFNIRKQIFEDCELFNVKYGCAHNALFDSRALNNTQRYQTTSQSRYFLPYGIEWLDTLKMARQILKKDDSYGKFCSNNNYITKNGQRRYTAEIIYRWLSGKHDFVESHTGLEDVDIERQIFEYFVNENPEINGLLWEDKMTWEQFYNFALENYVNGGDAVVECWTEADFDDYVADCGPITKTVAQKMFRDWSAICADIKNA